MDEIGIIGSGFGGLAAACTLAARGHKVVVFEKNDWLGGKAAVLESDGFRFDMGPTILTVPRVLERIFKEAKVPLESELDLVRLDPQWRCFFDDGSVLDLHQDTDAMRGALTEFTTNGSAAAGYDDFLKLSERLHDVSDKFFFWRSVEGFRDTINFGQDMTLTTLSDILSLRMGSTVAGTVRRRVDDPRVAQLLDHFIQYVGSSPYQAPAVLCAIAHMQIRDGIWYPKGGIRAMPTALTRLAEKLGVRFETNAEVRRIVVEDGQVRGVETASGTRIDLDAVVSNMDVVRTHKELLGGQAAGRFANGHRYEPACSGVVLYLGLDRAYDHILHHSFVFSRDAEEEFDWIYKRGEPAPDPTCYLAAPGRSDPSVAPDGGEALYILVHTPYLRPHHDWNAMFADYRKVILDKLARTAGMTDLEDRIVFESALTPQSIHDRYHVLNGAIYGLASHGRFLGAFKPGNRSRTVRNLYLAGGSAHPGPGMPMALMSGWIAADTLDQDLGGRMAS